MKPRDKLGPALEAARALTPEQTKRRPRGECTFRQRDVAAAIRAAKDAGLSVARVEIGKDGQITLVAGEPAKPGNGAAGPHPWDE